jgi:two-component system chemotaxis response regulator CheY
MFCIPGPQVAPLRAEEAGMSPYPRKKTVLVVDDDMVSRMALGGLLKRIPGFQVVEADDGLQALQMLEQGLRPLVCCSDIRMPGLGGLELMERTRAHPVFSQIPVILISGDSNRDTVHAALSRRPAGYIVKPFEAEETRMTVKRVVRATLEAEAEAPEDTCNRLGQDNTGLKNMLDVLAATVASEQDALGMPALDAGLAGRISRLRTACLILGLWRAARVLTVPPEAPPHGPCLLRAVLAEAAVLVNEQRSRHATEAALQAQEATV